MRRKRVRTIAWIILAFVVFWILLLLLPAACHGKAKAAGTYPEAEKVGFLHIAKLDVAPNPACQNQGVTVTVDLEAEDLLPPGVPTTLTVSYPGGTYTEVYPTSTVTASEAIHFSTPYTPTGYLITARALQPDGTGDFLSRTLTITECPIPGEGGTLAVSVTGFLTIRATGGYTLSVDWGSCLSWGDGTSVCFPGFTGDYEEWHTYAGYGTYTVTLTVEGEASTYITSVRVDFPEAPPPPVYRVFLPVIWETPPPPPPPPTCAIVNVVGPSPHDYTTTLSWSGASANWWLFYWGDESQTGAEPVGFWGSEGSETWAHTYNSGIWIQSATIQGPGGPGSCQQTVTVP